MREIKFRAWDGINNKWLLGYEYENLRGFSMFGEVMCFGEYTNMLNSFKIEDWHKIKLMQFTGLQDKNKVDIYDGDIFHCNKVNYVLKYLTYGGAYTIHNIKDLSDEIFLHHCNTQIEIIGNIYETPELLNK